MSQYRRKDLSLLQFYCNCKYLKYLWNPGEGLSYSREDLIGQKSMQCINILLRRIIAIHKYSAIASWDRIKYALQNLTGSNRSSSYFFVYGFINTVHLELFFTYYIVWKCVISDATMDY